MTLLTGAALPAGANAATDLVLAEPAATGNRRLLVRILRADGTPVGPPAGASGSSLGYLETVTSPSTTESWNRLVIERAAVVEPIFRVVLFPFRAGNALPATWTNTSPTNDYAVLNFTAPYAAQQDTFSFRTRTATVGGQSTVVRELILSRDGATLLDYRNQIEPTDLR